MNSLRYIVLPITRVGACVFTALYLSSCAALTGAKATADTFELAAAEVQDAQSVRRGAQILIAEPTALKALDSNNIVIKTTPLTIQYLDEAQWSDRLPRVVQQKLASSFESSNRFSGIGLPGQGLAIDYQVVTEIRAFSIVAGSNLAEVAISVKLLDDRSGNVISSKLFSASVSSGSSEPEAYVRALNAAFGDVSDEMVKWVASKI